MHFTSPNEYNFKKEYKYISQLLSITNSEAKLLISILHSHNIIYHVVKNKVHILEIKNEQIKWLLLNYCECFNHIMEHELINVQYDEKMKKYVHHGIDIRIIFNKE